MKSVIMESVILKSVIMVSVNMVSAFIANAMGEWGGICLSFGHWFSLGRNPTDVKSFILILNLNLKKILNFFIKSWIVVDVNYV
jgi:hypothetical protein